MKMKRKKTKNYENIKIYTLGNSTVGKTSFILRFTEDYFNNAYIQTIGIDYQTKIITLNGKTYSVNFYDTAGQERYKSISVNSIKWADGILLMYDITNKKSFDAIPQWMKDIIENKGINFPIILIGNKCDLEDEREVTKDEGEQLAKNYGVSFFETSNKDDVNIKNVGTELINQIIQIREKKRTDLLKEFDFLLVEKDTFELDINNYKKEKKENKENINHNKNPNNSNSGCF